MTFHHSKNCWNVWNHTHSAPTNSICKLLTHIFFSASTPLCRSLSVHFLIWSTLKMIKLIKWEMSNCIKTWISDHVKIFVIYKFTWDFKCSGPTKSIKPIHDFKSYSDFWFAKIASWQLLISILIFEVTG